MATRGRPKGCVKTGGRIKGSLDKNQRQLITGEIANDILAVYQAMGGAAFLLDYAKTRPEAFIRDCLSRLMPAPQKDDAVDIQTNVQVNIDGEFEAARRIAFALSKAAYALKEREPVATVTPQEACNPHWQPPDAIPDSMPLLSPEPIEDPERERWASELHLSDEERADQRLIRQTKEANLTNYIGSSAEQCGPGPVRPSPAQSITINGQRFRKPR
ncbi:hypothetical protein NVV94_05315 [Pseudomonas sp. LS1212]|uniref:hypothetical protein n=1 Tax=Pseudomonas sp. LS1212 TaxID=2972478 RepID=UPI00215D10D3|nr:hypothetical protein [Pseudomonas sp. LS1212]UVJ45003.1 hypothetical protein NVV94_05315 [Pseudomonas sp. LS1212]